MKNCHHSAANCAEFFIIRLIARILAQSHVEFFSKQPPSIFTVRNTNTFRYRHIITPQAAPSILCKQLVSLVLALCLTLGCTALIARVAAAQSFENAQVAYAEGRFLDAAQMGENLETSEGFALAAQSLTIYAHYIAEENKQKTYLEQAVELAHKAVRADANNANAHLQLARAIGRHSQSMGKIEAARSGVAKKVREAAENALELNPQMALAHLSLGRLRAELIDALGPLLARMLYKAKKKDALASLEQALKLAPHSKEVLHGYALGILALDDDKYRDKALDHINRAIEIPATDAYEQLLHTRAVELLADLEAGGG